LSIKLSQQSHKSTQPNPETNLIVYPLSGQMGTCPSNHHSNLTTSTQTNPETNLIVYPLSGQTGTCPSSHHNNLPTSTQPNPETNLIVCPLNVPPNICRNNIILNFLKHQNHKP
jgi:hypothetical protein